MSVGLLRFIDSENADKYVDYFSIISSIFFGNGAAKESELSYADASAVVMFFYRKNGDDS